MAQNEMEAMLGLPVRVRLTKGLARILDSHTHGCFTATKAASSDINPMDKQI
jgi:hypothetical protein